MYCNVCNKYRKFKKIKISYIFKKTLSLSVVYQWLKSFFWDAVRHCTQYSLIRIRFSRLAYDLFFISNETAKILK